MMKKTIGTIALLALGVALVLAPAPARAACGVDVSFGQVSGGHSGCGGYCYVQSPGLRTPASVQSNFWALGLGNPALGPGIDNGGWADNGWLVDLGFGGGVNLAGSWAGDATIDGCVENAPAPQKMVITMSDQDSLGNNAYFAIACVTRSGGATEFDYTKIVPEGNIVLKALPNVAGTNSPVKIASSTRTAPEANIQVGSPDFSSIYYSDGSPGCAIANVIKQYDVWIKQVPRPGGVAPTDRNSISGGWTLGGTCNIGANCPVVTTCGTANCNAYLAVSPRLDSGFQVGDAPNKVRLSANSLPVQAGATLAEPPPFKVIKKGGGETKRQ
jgi:hypothetical protein